MKARSSFLAALLAATPAAAVYVNPDGLGQALVYPYYTAQPSNGNPFNTYISIANNGDDAKAIRVRFREGRASREVLAFNLFLKPHDMWTGAVVPLDDTAGLLSADSSCTDPPFEVSSAPGPLPLLRFRRDSYAGANADGSGDGYDRLREGFVEAIEMATLPGGVPANCGAGVIPASFAPPTGGLSGSLTLINVASGMDFTVNADALADLAQQPFFRVAKDPYPDFNAREITPASTVIANGALYRSVWTRGVDAVSAALLRSAFKGEYILDPGTRSHTDWVVTFPTRAFYATSTGATAPFTEPSGWAPQCNVASPPPLLGEPVGIVYFNREERSASPACSPGEAGASCPGTTICASTSIFGFAYDVHFPYSTSASSVVGSTTGGFDLGDVPLQSSSVFANGWVELVPGSRAPLVSQPDSTRTDLVTGAVTRGVHSHYGLPVTGFAVRTFVNGNLACNEGICQGNYGGAFPLRYERSITTP